MQGAARQTLLAALVLLATAAAAAPSAPVQSVTVVGTAFRVTLSDGTVLPQESLPGTALMFGDGSGQQRRVRIDAVESDPRDPEGEVMLYALSEQDPASGEWRDACQLDPAAAVSAFPLPAPSPATGATWPRPGGS